MKTAYDKLTPDEKSNPLTTQQAGYEGAHNAGTNSTNNGDPPGMGFCWTHGLGFDPNHKSCTCNRPAPGHQVEATLQNMMGGNPRIRRKPGDRQVYVPPTRRNNNNNPATGAGSGAANGAANGNDI